MKEHVRPKPEGYVWQNPYDAQWLYRATEPEGHDFYPVWGEADIDKLLDCIDDLQNRLDTVREAVKDPTLNDVSTVVAIQVATAAVDPESITRECSAAIDAAITRLKEEA